MSLVEILIGFDDSIFVSVSLCSRSYAIIGSICKYSIHGSDTRGNKRIVKRLESNDNLILMNRKNRWTELPSFLFLRVSIVPLTKDSLLRVISLIYKQIQQIFFDFTY